MMNTNELQQTQHIRLKLIPVIASAVMVMAALAGMLAAPALAAKPKTVTIAWVEAGNRYSYDGTLQETFAPDTIGPLDMLQTGKTYHSINITDFYRIPGSDTKGSVVISGSGNLTAEITYVINGLLLRDLIYGTVTVDPDVGTLSGTYTQYRQAYGTRAEVLAAYPYAIPDKSPNARGWWFLDYTEYVASSVD